MAKRINQEIVTASVSTANELIGSIKKRELYISSIGVHMIKQWYLQGQELQQLRVHQCSQNALTALTGISKGSVYNYISISKDLRILELIESDHRGGQLESFNQKQLVKLTKLTNFEFEESIEAGAIVSPEKTIVSETEHINTLWIRKPVTQMDSKGQVVAQYPSAKLAQTITGIDRMTIGKVCRGRASSAGNYFWCFTA